MLIEFISIIGGLSGLVSLIAILIFWFYKFGYYASKVDLLCSVWLPIFISLAAILISSVSLFWNVVVELKRSKAKLEVLQRNHFYTGGEDERTEIELLFRNLSHRPIAIIDIYVREKKGGILGGSGYNNRIKLPIQLEPWGIIQASFRIEKK